RVVHFHNLESELSFLQLQNSDALPQAFQRWVHRKNFEKLKIHEAELVELGRELWFLSPVDMAKFQRERGQVGRQPECALLRLVPPTFSAEISKWPGQVKGNTKHTILGLIGGFDFQPNIDSAKWILDHLVPALEKSGFKGKVQIAGRSAQSMISTIFKTHPQSKSPILEVLPDGFDVDVFFAGLSWMLVPHLSGSGVRIKLLDALSKKIPVMATPSAVERLHPELHEYPLIFSSDDPTLWANRALGETPQGTRLKYQDLAFPQAMCGTEIYRDV
ncbi:MAG: hypothetical protein ABI041_08485, partial [Bdellovibrionia bacterium]